MIAEEVRKYKDDIEASINAFLIALNLPTFQYFGASPFDVTQKDLSIAVYLTNSVEGTATYDGSDSEFSWNVVYRHSDSVEEEMIEENVDLYSALFDFLKNKNYGELSTIRASGVFRMDENESWNGGVFEIRTRLNTSIDYAW